MALGSTESVTEMSTRNIYWGSKGGRCVGLTNLPHSCAVLKYGSLMLVYELRYNPEGRGFDSR